MAAVAEGKVALGVAKGLFRAGQYFWKRAKLRRIASITVELKVSADVQHRIVLASTHFTKLMPPRRVKQLESYLGSPEFQSLCRQLVALRLLYGESFEEAADDALGVLSAGMRLYLDDLHAENVDISAGLFRCLLNAVREHLENTKGVWAQLEDPSFRHFLTRQEELIHQAPDLFETDRATASIAWLKKYRTVAKDRYGKIKAPHWDAQVIVPIDEIYVPARLQLPKEAKYDSLRIAFPRPVAMSPLYDPKVFSEYTRSVGFSNSKDLERHTPNNLTWGPRAQGPWTSKSRSVDRGSVYLWRVERRSERLDGWDARLIQEAAAEVQKSSGISYTEMPIDRTVVLGDPGAGKTTLASRIALDVLEGKTFLNFVDSAPTLPLVITLREHSARSPKTSFLKYITESVRDDLQCPAPPGLVDFLLAAGRAMVIFDGLDELLDTSLRRQVTTDIESFAAAYPNAPLLVTSRSMGYDRAPLDPEVFTPFHIEQFNPSETTAYVQRWFAMDTSITPASDRQNVADSFLATAGEVQDLISNPLLLALLCNLYKATGYLDLPRSRPAILEKCSLVLFDRWDRYRRIGDVDFERDFEPVVAHLAYEAFTTGGHATGFIESALVQTATNFLWPRLHKTEDSARSFARALVEHCRDRAWVFTDVGTTRDGEMIYQFTHRTFMEYFAALHIFRRYRTPQAVIKLLIPHIRDVDWGLVPTLAVQIMSRRFDSAADEVVIELCSRNSRRLKMSEYEAGLAFAADVIRHTPVSSETVETLVSACHERSARHVLPDPNLIVTENRDALVEALNSFSN